MAYKMNEIIPNLYLGNIVNSMDKRHLDEFKISKIVSVYEKGRQRFPDREYLLVKVYDRNSERIIEHFSRTNEFIHEARLKTQNVLVHCVKGVSRSVAVVVAYIMTVTNLSFEGALKVVRASRPIAKPNDGFQKQLEEFEKFGCQAERIRLRNCELSISDEKFCSLVLKKSYENVNIIDSNKANFENG